MYIISFAAGLEPLDNYRAALHRLVEWGARCEMVLYATARQQQARRDHPGENAPTIVVNAEGNDVHDRLVRFAAEVVDKDPDVFFHLDADSVISSMVTRSLRERGYRGLIIGAQGRLTAGHGMLQNADRVLCFGKRQMARLSAVHRASAYSPGLPWLDRLEHAKVGQEEFAVFLAHATPEPPVIDATLAAFERACGIPIVVVDHPDFPDLYKHRPSAANAALNLQAGTLSGEGLLRRCKLVIATDSSRILDALYMGKATVLLPNAGLVGFDGYPGISEGFSPAAINAATRRIIQQPERVAQFIEATVGGVRYDHTESVARLLVRLLSSGPLRSRSTVSARQAASGVPAGSIGNEISTRVELAGFVPPGGRAAELGVAKGVFSDELLRSRPDIHLFSIDRWAGDRGHDDAEYRAACELLGQHGTRCSIVRKAFDAALEDFAPESLDLIYIDGYAHDGQQAGKTLEDWWSRLKPGGVFAGHDYHPDWRATMDAVDAFCKRHRLVVHTTSEDFFPSWYVHKPTGQP